MLAILCPPHGIQRMVSTQQRPGPPQLLWQHKKKSQEFNFFFLLKQRNFLETPLFILGDFAALHVHPLYTVHRIHTGQDAWKEQNIPAQLHGMVWWPKQWKGPKPSLSLLPSSNCLAKLLSRHLCFALPWIFGWNLASPRIKGKGQRGLWRTIRMHFHIVVANSQNKPHSSKPGRAQEVLDNAVKHMMGVSGVVLCKAGSWTSGPLWVPSKPGYWVVLPSTSKVCAVSCIYIIIFLILVSSAFVRFCPPGYKFQCSYVACVFKLPFHAWASTNCQ